MGSSYDRTVIVESQMDWHSSGRLPSMHRLPAHVGDGRRWLLPRHEVSAGSDRINLMKETRQQRRARERAEAKTASRPGPNASAGGQDRQPAGFRPIGSVSATDVVEVRLQRIVEEIVDQDPDGYVAVTWGVEWGIRDGSWGIEDSGSEPRELVDGVVADIRKSANARTVPLQWTIEGDHVDGQTPEAAIESAGITLPATTQPPTSSGIAKALGHQRTPAARDMGRDIIRDAKRCQVTLLDVAGVAVHRTPAA